MKKGLIKEANIMAVEMTTQELASLIDNVVEAIDKTAFGPLVEYGGTAAEPKKLVNQVAFPVFLQVLSTLLTKVDAFTLVPDAPQSDIVTSVN